VRQIGSVLVELPLQLIDDAGKFATFFDQARNNVIFARGHAAALCQ
jgi:hypothetical protein